MSLNYSHTGLPNSPLSFCYTDPEISVNSGQMFLWQKFDNSWYGVYGDHILKFSILGQDKEGTNEYDNVQFLSFPEFKNWERHVFRLDDDIKNILSGFGKDLILSKAIRMYPGLRVMRQEPQQCMISFACASNTNIAMIRRMLSNICKKFGDPVSIDGREFFTFPNADRLNKVTTNELLSCAVGYRVKAIKAVANAIASNNIDIDYLKRAKYNASKEELLKIYGIGNKISDCILLFSLDKLEAFPIDVWITRVLSLFYPWLLNENKKENDNKQRTLKTDEKLLYRYKYEILSENIRRHFGKYAGYAQQYLFYYIRQKESRKW
ncbi:MAG: DNA-3-methyladenine glycosylase family protein [Nitrososphaeraceae archaeon]